MTGTKPRADVTEIKQALDVLFRPGDVVELRALEVGGKVHAGYFNSYGRLANEAARLSGQAAGVYVALNSTNPDLLARAANRMVVGLKNVTQDKDIIRRRWLPIDIDAIRPSGISSTDQEHAAAITVAKAIKEYLTELGFPAGSIFTGDSGNGAHVLIRIDLPNDAEGTATVKACLKAIAAKFNSSQVSIDLSVFNAARIWKLPGTLARKGDSTETRPHRIAKLLDVPASIATAPVEIIQALASTVPEPEAPRQAERTYHGGGQPFDLESWLTNNGIEVKSSGPYEGGIRYILKACPFNPEHGGTSAAIFQTADGAVGFKCHHNSCADKTWADLRELKEPGYRDRKNGRRAYEPQAGNNGIPPETRQRPMIVTNNRQLRDIRADVLTALEAKNNPPFLFRHGGGLARISKDENGRPYVDHYDLNSFGGLLTQICDFCKVIDEEQDKAVPPPQVVIKDCLSLNDWSFPSVSSITEIPVICPDGTILSEPGYHRMARLYYEPARGLVIPMVPDNPTQNEIQEAINLIKEPIIDFPFENEAAAANAIGMLVTPIAIPIITSPVPLSLIDKPTPGTGASKLAEIASIIATGHPAAIITVPKDDESMRKLITSILVKGQTVVILDNIEFDLFSPSLAALLTSTTWQDRILGQTKTLTLENKTIWLATGNNISLKGDLPRRCVSIRLDAKEAKPWQRNVKNFKHPDLIPWVMRNRGRIIAAILTVIRAWHNAGRPCDPDLKPLGGYESYSEVIGGIVKFMGLKGYLTNLDEMYRRADTETPQWEAFLEAWIEIVGDKGITSAELISLFETVPAFKAALPESLADLTVKNYSKILGNALRKKDGVRYSNNLMLINTEEKKHNSILWKVGSYDPTNSPVFSLKGELGELHDIRSHEKNWTREYITQGSGSY